MAVRDRPSLALDSQHHGFYRSKPSAFSVVMATLSRCTYFSSGLILTQYVNVLFSLSVNRPLGACAARPCRHLLFDACHECVHHLMVAYLEKVPFLFQLASPLAHRGGWPYALRYHLLLTYWHRDERSPKWFRFDYLCKSHNFSFTLYLLFYSNIGTFSYILFVPSLVLQR